MEFLIQDVRYAARKLARTPAFTLIVIATVGLAVGATTAVFSIVNGVLLNPLGFARPDRLVFIQGRDPAGKPMSISPRDMLDFRDRTNSFTSVAAIDGRSMNLVRQSAPALRISAARVGATFFSILGVRAERGRTFAPSEDQPGASNVVVLSDAAWRRYFGGDSSIVGTPITLDENPYTVIGIAPPRFTYPSSPDVWYPAVWRDWEIGDRYRGFHSIGAIARLRDGATRESAEREVQGVAASIAEAFPQYDAKISATLTPLRERIVGGVERPLWAMFGAVGFVLLIACANVANLLLVRAAARKSEVAVRAALGAGRRRMLQQLMMESVLLALVGAALGVLLASWSIDAVTVLAPSAFPRIDEIAVDARVLMFAVIVAAVAALVFGWLPALDAGASDITQLLRAGSRASTQRASRTHSLLVIAELSLGMVLLVGAGLLIHSFERLTHVDPGFRPDHLVVFNVALSAKKYETDASRIAFADALLSRLRAMPGTQSAAVAADRPIDPNRPFEVSTSFWHDGRPKPAPGSEWESRVLPVSPSYFQTLGMHLVRGRTFLDAENRLDAAPVIVINEALARRYFPGENPIGKRLTFGLSHTFTNSPGDSVRARGEIVGVVKNVQQQSLDAKEEPSTYFPFNTLPFGPTFLVRTSADLVAVKHQVRAEVEAVDAAQPIYELGAMDAAMSESVAQPRFYTLLLTAFAAVALFLAALGTYGVVAYAASQRTREFGVRIALGAAPRDVMRLVVRRGVALAAMGVLVGALLAAVATRTLEGLLFGVQPLELSTFLIVALVLGGAATFASWLPARRAARVDPLIAMRSE